MFLAAIILENERIAVIFENKSLNEIQRGIPVSNRTKFYINGEWVAPSTSDTIDVINPATEQPIGQVAMGGAADVDKAVAVQSSVRNVFSDYREERISLLEAIIAKYSERMGDVAAAISEEMGAP